MVHPLPEHAARVPDSSPHPVAPQPSGLPSILSLSPPAPWAPWCVRSLCLSSHSCAQGLGLGALTGVALGEGLVSLFMGSH